MGGALRDVQPAGAVGVRLALRALAAGAVEPGHAHARRVRGRPSGGCRVRRARVEHAARAVPVGWAQHARARHQLVPRDAVALRERIRTCVGGEVPRACNGRVGVTPWTVSASDAHRARAGASEGAVAKVARLAQATVLGWRHYRRHRVQRALVLHPRAAPAVGRAGLARGSVLVETRVAAPRAVGNRGPHAGVGCVANEVRATRAPPIRGRGARDALIRPGCGAGGGAERLSR